MSGSLSNVVKTVGAVFIPVTPESGSIEETKNFDICFLFSDSFSNGI